MEAKKSVIKLKCKVCMHFLLKIEERRNYSKKLISRAKSIRTSNIKDNSNSDRRVHAMLLQKKNLAEAHALSAASYAPIAQALQQLPEDTRRMLWV
jgi:hypothetical protein